MLAFPRNTDTLHMICSFTDLPSQIPSSPPSHTQTPKTLERGFPFVSPAALGQHGALLCLSPSLNLASLSVGEHTQRCWHTTQSSSVTSTEKSVIAL